MTLQEIIKSGESKNLEFKEALPEKSIKYMKSVIAFANGMGGRIIFGIDDQRRNVSGFDKNEVFAIMDAIANAISDCCEPAIIPDITLQTVEDKTIIVVEIAEGRQKPYYIKSQGRYAGVYIRVAGTTRLADEYMIKELILEGSNRHYDQVLCLGLDVNDAKINHLCEVMKNQAIKNARTEEQKSSVKDVGLQQLCAWGILTEREGEYCPTNAYAILTGCGEIPIVIQCAVFKGSTKAVFLDRREYSGPIWEQIDEAYRFVLRNIHLGAVFEGVYRQDVYEIPPDAIRELIINAVVHRSYLDNGNIQVAIYDNRLEITSPGKLPMGQTLSKMKEGYSVIRNEALAYAFSYMNLIEHWGSGIPRIIEEVKEAGLKEPEFIGGEVELRINIYRVRHKVDNEDKNGTESAVKMPLKCRQSADKVPVNEQKRKIYEYVLENTSVTTSKAMEILNVKQRRARNILVQMVDEEWLRKEGASRSTVYVLNEHK